MAKSVTGTRNRSPDRVIIKQSSFVGELGVAEDIRGYVFVVPGETLIAEDRVSNELDGKVASPEFAVQPPGVVS